MPDMLIVTGPDLRQVPFSQVVALSDVFSRFVSPRGSDSDAGSQGAPYRTINRALAGAPPGATIYIAPGTYAENVVVSTSSTSIIGLGPPKSSLILPASGTAMTVTGQYTMLSNLDISAGTGATRGTLIQADNVTVQDCKFECNDNAGIGIEWQSVGISGLTASIGRMINCELAWSAIGCLTKPGLGAPVTELRVNGGFSHNCTTAAFTEDEPFSVLDLFIENFTCGDGEGTGTGAQPTAYISLNNGSGNVNTGMVAGCTFPVALLSSGKNTVSTGIKWIANKHTDGISTGQPT